jgi:hypothetical protein
MSDLTRYVCTHGGMDCNDEGDWVRFDDYDALVKVAEITSDFAIRRDNVATALAARVKELEANLNYIRTVCDNMLDTQPIADDATAGVDHE